MIYRAVTQWDVNLMDLKLKLVFQSIFLYLFRRNNNKKMQGTADRIFRLLYRTIYLISVLGLKFFFFFSLRKNTWHTDNELYHELTLVYSELRLFPAYVSLKTLLVDL